MFPAFNFAKPVKITNKQIKKLLNNAKKERVRVIPYDIINADTYKTPLDPETAVYDFVYTYDCAADFLSDEDSQIKRMMVGAHLISRGIVLEETTNEEDAYFTDITEGLTL